VAGARVTDVYRITIGDGRSTEELVEAGNYGYAHSYVTSENFPARPLAGRWGARSRSSSSTAT